MEVYDTEEQQIEALKKWFQKKGKLLITALSFIIILISSIQYGRHHIKITREAASTLYQAMLLAIDQQDKISAKTKADHLSKEYESYVYGTIAKLYLAKVAIEDQKWNQAQSYLEWVMHHSKSPEFQEVARLRLARLLFSQKKIPAALQLLDQKINQKNNQNKHYLSLLQELKADILSVQTKPQEAHGLYKIAQENLKKEVYHPLLSLKLEEGGEG